MSEERLIFLVFLLKDLDGHIIDSSVIKHHYTAIGARLYVHADVFTEFIVYAAEIVAYCLNGDVEFVGYATSSSVGQTVFQSAKFVECDGLAHTISI